MEDFEAAEQVVRALCWIGAAPHSKDHRNQAEIAKAIYYEWIENGDEFFKPDEALTQHLAKSMGIDPTRLKKAP